MEIPKNTKNLIKILKLQRYISKNRIKIEKLKHYKRNTHIKNQFEILKMQNISQKIEKLKYYKRKYTY